MDQDIRDALSDIKIAVRDGLSDVKGQISDLVTRSEFRATIERVDSQHATLKSAFENHEKGTADHMEDVRKADQENADAANRAIEAVRDELKTSLEGFRVTTRWALGIALTGTALIFGGIQWLISI